MALLGESNVADTFVVRVCLEVAAVGDVVEVLDILFKREENPEGPNGSHESLFGRGEIYKHGADGYEKPPERRMVAGVVQSCDDALIGS